VDAVSAVPDVPVGAVVAVRVRVSGLVQGVGFRPFVWREATRRGLRGWVGNDAAGVVLEAEGPPDAVGELIAALHVPPPLARVDEVSTEPRLPTGFLAFEVRVSDTGGPKVAQVSPDTATCADCLAELHDPADRRFGYPFVNCTNCGPRYTIVESVPYDRSRTTMAPFPMCPDCRREYDDPADRRFHAEPVCCPACGPQLRLVDATAVAVAGDPLAQAVALLRRGGVLAVKGLGGYHLVVDALQEAAVALLRSRKHREDRPFALMVGDVGSAEVLCQVSAAERALLTSVARPIVLMAARADNRIAPSVAPGAPTLGLMLPYTPLHALLLEACAGPLVATSGNASDEPIAFVDDDALTRLAGIADAFLVHDRAIRTRVDDSVVKVVAGRPVPLRRSRGFTPQPIRLSDDAGASVLGCGAGLKNTFCLTRGSLAFVSHHIGDLGDHATLSSYVEGIAHLQRLLDVTPTVVAHDLHPDYPSTQHALDLPDVELVGVQHHHAHIASCLADNGVTGPAIGVAFDGLGLGTDGTAWGGEFLISDLVGFERVGHLAPVPMPGGDAATRQPWRMAAAYLEAAFEGAPPAGLDVVGRHRDRWDQVLSLARAGVNAPLTSSAGRLFDAVSAVLGIRDVVTYEGQAAIELEYAADPRETASYALGVADRVVPGPALLRAVTEDLLAGSPVAAIAARFHNTLADAVLGVCRILRDERALTTVALSGGVFQNSRLVAGCVERLEASGFTVLTHRQVPPNDGGVSLGQAAVAAGRLRARAS
jgi:hydrogenase maturation protein HypF